MALGAEPVVDRREAVHSAEPGEAAGAPPRLLAHLRLSNGIAQHVGDGARVILGIVAVDQEAGHAVLHHLAQPTDGRGDHRCPECLRLERHQPEALRQGRHDAHIGHRVIHGQLLVRDRTDKADVIAESDTSGVTLQPAALAAAVEMGAVPAVVARDDHGKVVILAAGPESGHGVEQNLRPFQRFEPAGEQRDAGALETEAAAQTRAVVLGEEAGVDTRLGHADPVSRGAVQSDQVLGLRRACRHEPVCLSGELALGLRTKRIEWQARARLGQRERVEGLHPRNVPGFAKPTADEASMPVVAVDRAIGAVLRFGVPDGRLAELVEQRTDVLFADRLGWPHRESHQPAQRRDQLLVRTWSVASNEHVGGHPAQ